MSKLNPQNATAYVGPGVLRKGGKITKVPDGPLIKKKGPFKGSTLKSGGTIKKAQNGDTLTVKKPMTYAEKRAAQEIVKQKNIRVRDSILNRNASAKGMTREQVKKQQVADKKKPDATSCDLNDPNFSSTKCGISKAAAKQSKSDFKKKKNGGLIKRADGSMSKRGLWDNIRANKGSGKKPTKQMLVQEKKIKAKTKK
jgi:hypothetical protein